MPVGLPWREQVFHVDIVPFLEAVTLSEKLYAVV